MNPLEDMLPESLGGNENTESKNHYLNDVRTPTNVQHELFNQNELLKRLLQDDIAEGM